MAGGGGREGGGCSCSAHRLEWKDVLVNWFTRIHIKYRKKRISSGAMYIHILSDMLIKRSWPLYREGIPIWKHVHNNYDHTRKRTQTKSFLFSRNYYCHFVYSIK